MKLFDVWRKQKSTDYGNDVDVDNLIEDTRFRKDSIKKHLSRALASYCAMENTTKEEVVAKLKDKEDDQTRVIEKTLMQYAGNHIAYFLTWLIEKGFYNEHGDEEVLKSLNKVRAKEIDGYRFLTECCGNKLTREMISTSGIDFVDSYYNDRFKMDYNEYVIKVLGERVNGLTFSWEQYDNFKGLIDIAYENYRIKERIKAKSSTKVNF